MAGAHSPSSSQEPMYSIAAQSSGSKAGSRRLPPPCWSDEETVALIEVYRDKWYSLRRGNLRAPDWEEVADGVAARCPNSNPPKTSIQCRHKMEKLRKRYRSEIQRIGNIPKGHRYHSSWIHFKLMDSMELGLGLGFSSDPSVDLADEGADEIEDDLMLYNPLKSRNRSSIGPGVGSGSRIGNRVRIKIPNFDDFPPPMNRQYGSGKGSRNGYSKDRIDGGGMKRRKDDDGNVMDEMVAAIQRLGDGFVKMEKMKMDMARELESMRMKAEMKQTEMILETQQKLWDWLSETVVEKENKKIKRMSTPES